MTKTILSQEDRETITSIAGLLAGIGLAHGDIWIKDPIRICANSLEIILAGDNALKKHETTSSAADAKSGKKPDSAAKRVDICKKDAEKDESGNIFSTFTDPRDGQIYYTVYIPKLEQTWMLENLEYNPKKKGHWKKKNQHYYTWDLAQKVAPKGWRLPSKEDFEKIVGELGAEKFLKLWNRFENAKQGYVEPYSGGLYNQGSLMNSWSSTQGSTLNAYYLYVNASSVYPGTYGNCKNLGFTVRCIKN